MKLSFYQIDVKYCDFLRKTDACVPYTMDTKSTRPFVGIVFSIGEYSYYAPLTSPKPKHLHMKNQVDFLKINGGAWGAINFNNMIPVPLHCLKKVEMNIVATDTKEEIDYKNLLKNQLTWCNANRERIIHQAQKLYRMVVENRAHPDLAQRCCNFVQDEHLCSIFTEL